MYYLELKAPDDTYFERVTYTYYWRGDERKFGVYNVDFSGYETETYMPDASSGNSGVESVTITLGNTNSLQFNSGTGVFSNNATTQEYDQNDCFCRKDLPAVLRSAMKDYFVWLVMKIN